MIMEDLEKEIKDLKEWKKINKKLEKKFKFKDFVEAFGFVTRIALIAEKMNHHPDIKIIYNNVDIELTTHDIDGISMNDVALARKIDELV
ncbi:putative pterin-4-alpha-carbinolamine dehydratase [Candidatus Nitrosocosmicus franklandus]|uniref:Putative pterin-4-alpha-carbinolamine dehydratase n=2 Tax=Candidatus Nitrosocosmicus franklandianus TaxID=1798806 RepID=A0A484IAA0_9ARCH|nr:putative pterin-4-alpha-carbinolamine dehydratase [Candidatus Nitrosocosmicus franklandus]